MTRCLIALVLSVAALSSGCSTVAVTERFGSPLNESELRQFAGTWSVGDGNVFQAQLAEPNMLLAASMNWDRQAKDFKIQRVKLYIHRLEEHQYAFLAKPKGEAFLFYRIARQGDSVSIYPANQILLHKAVQSQQLAGKVEKTKNRTETTIHANSTEVVTFFAEHPDAFDKKAMLTFKRIGGGPQE